MEHLIKIETSKEGDQIVSAKDLYDFLAPTTRFDKWISRMLEYDFVENADYQRLDKIGQTPNGGKRVVFDDFVLTLDAAKEISMLQRSERGKQARQYFIACEKKLKEIVKPTNTLDLMQMALDQMRLQDQRLTQVEDKVLLIEAQTVTRPDYFTIMGFAILNRVKVSLTMAAQLGRKAKTICSQKGYQVDKVRDPRFGEVGVYPTEVLQHVFDNTQF